eukprot:tig00000743_g3872.t1
MRVLVLVLHPDPAVAAILRSYARALGWPCETDPAALDVGGRSRDAPLALLADASLSDADIDSRCNPRGKRSREGSIAPSSRTSSAVDIAAAGPPADHAPAPTLERAAVHSARLAKPVRLHRLEAALRAAAAALRRAHKNELEEAGTSVLQADRANSQTPATTPGEETAPQIRESNRENDHELKQDPEPQLQETRSASGRFAVDVVDDVDLNRKVAAAMLAKAGLPSAPAVHGLAAVEAMPVLGGVEATREIRKLEAAGLTNGPPSAILALTANAVGAGAIAERCREAGMDGFLVKPLRKDVLLAEIEKHAPSLLPPDGPRPPAGPRPAVGASTGTKCPGTLYS